MKSLLSFSTLSILTVVTLFTLPDRLIAQVPNLRSAANFVLFTTTGEVKNTGASQITGNVGTNAGAISGFGLPSAFSGSIFIPSAYTLQCSLDVLDAYMQLSVVAPTSVTHAPAFGSGETLTPGVYAIAAAGSVAGDLYLDALGDPEAVFIFKFGLAFSTGAGSTIHLLNGALSRNVFWIAGGAMAMDAGTTIKGTLIANVGAVSMGAGGNLEGRLLSATGAVTIVSGTVISPAVPVILPVKLVNFRASITNNAVHLVWIASQVSALSSYNLERSADGINFHQLVSIPAINTAANTTYLWRDRDPLKGAGFYRLKMTGVDGVSEYSFILKTFAAVQRQMTIYTNPLIGKEILLQMAGQLKGDYLVRLYNMFAGQVMSSQIMHDGNDAIKSIYINHELVKGVYYLEITDPQKSKKTLKVLIN